MLNFMMTAAMVLSFSMSFMAEAKLKNKTDGEYVSLTGKVTEVSANNFWMTANGNTILVEMDDYDLDSDGYKLVKGDNVVVTGRVDNAFLEKKKVEAGVVYVKNIDAYFYSNSADEEGDSYISTSYLMMDTLPENATVDLKGTVTKINGREFTIDTGLRKVTIDTASLKLNPMDNIGFVQIDKGDFVRVSGLVDKNYFDGTEVSAKYISEL